LTLITHLTAVTLNDYMRGNNLWRLFKVLAIALVVILSLSGILFFLAFFFQNDLWLKLNEWQANISGFTRWQRLLPVTLVVAIFTSIFVWRNSRTLDIRYYGKISLTFVLSAVIIGAIMQNIPQHAKPLNNLGPILALEFVSSYSDVVNILGTEPYEAAKELKLALWLDSLLFIPLYVGFLLFFSRLLYLKRGSWVKYVVRGVTISILIAGLADYIENFFSYYILESFPVGSEHWIYQTVYFSASIKWGLTALVIMALSLVFWRNFKGKE
jgi:hypothetical protein